MLDTVRVNQRSGGAGIHYSTHTLPQVVLTDALTPSLSGLKCIQKEGLWRGLHCTKKAHKRVGLTFLQSGCFFL